MRRAQFVVNALDKNFVELMKLVDANAAPR